MRLNNYWWGGVNKKITPEREECGNMRLMNRYKQPAEES